MASTKRNSVNELLSGHGRAAEVQAELDKEEAKRLSRPFCCKWLRDASSRLPRGVSFVHVRIPDISFQGAGKCEDTYKPRYCTKECQVEDWTNHKRMCKPGLESVQSQDSPPSHSPMDFSVTLRRFEIPREGPLSKQPKNSTPQATHGGKYSVEIDGVKFHASSSQVESIEEAKRLSGKK